MGILVEGFLAEADVLDGSCVRIAYELDKSIDPKPTHRERLYTVWRKFVLRTTWLARSGTSR
jgi:hypothetical protein